MTGGMYLCADNTEKLRGSPRRIIAAVATAVVSKPVAPGDYVLNHVGFAIRRIPAEDVGATLALYERLLAQDGADLMTADVRGEIAAGE